MIIILKYFNFEDHYDAQPLKSKITASSVWKELPLAKIVESATWPMWKKEWKVSLYPIRYVE